MDSPGGFSDHDILVEVRDLLVAHIANYEDDLREVERELGRRPTRGELLGFFTLAGVLSGVIFQLLT